MTWSVKGFLFLACFMVVWNYTESWGGESDCQPQQIHLALGGICCVFLTNNNISILFTENSFDIVVTWSTFNLACESMVEYGTSDLSYLAVGSYKTFVDGIHKVTLRELSPSTKYFYHSGGREWGWSSEYWFFTSSNQTTTPISIAMFGDLGNENPRSLPTLQKETQIGTYDAILHIGDFAYDLDEDDGRVGDAFMNQIEPVAAYVPYMVCVGNHEAA